MRQYPSKLILFGEYSVVMGSQVLGIPVFDSYGYWSKESGPNSFLSDELFDYLKSSCSEFLDEHRINELSNGRWHYRSNIKRGYGMGSSGALSAAIYDYCAIEPENDNTELQHFLSIIESFFHGKSSGFDPLISIKACPVMRDAHGSYKLLDRETMPTQNLDKIYLLDSGDKRRVKGLVPKFVSLYENDTGLYSELTNLNNNLIDHFLDGDSITQPFAELSKFQLDHMSPMIMDHLVPFWKQGLDSGDYYVKICGSGGGGYYLIYVLNDQWLESELPYQLVPIVRS